MALSQVKQLCNLHLIEEAIKVSAKSLQEINRLRQTYRSDLPVYSVPSGTKCISQNCKIKISTGVGSDLPSPKKENETGKGKSDMKSTAMPSSFDVCPFADSKTGEDGTTIS